MKVRVFDIDWDTDEEAVDCPTEVVIEIPEDSEYDLDEDLGGILTEAYGWCINGCNYEVIKE